MKTKKINTLIISTLLLSLLSCDNVNNTDTNNIVLSDTYFNINANSISLTIKTPDKYDILLDTIVKDFKDEINNKFECEFIFNEEINENSINLLIGDTNFDLSNSLKAKLNEDSFGITVLDNSIAILGTTSYLTYKGLDYLLKNLISYDENNNLQIHLKNGYTYIEKAEAYPKVSEVLNSNREVTFYATEVLATVPSKNGYYYMQGAGSDGKYAYVGMIKTDIIPETCLIYKYDLKTWELVAVSEPLETAHTNDITYDSVADRLVISTCSSTDNYAGLAYVNKDTLQLEEYIVTDLRIRAVSFLKGKNKFVFGSSYNYLLTNYSYEVEKTFKDKDPRYITQGFDCDGTNIYDIRWNNEVGVDHQIITINSIVTGYIKTGKLIGIEGEPENIIVDGNSFIVGCSHIMDNMYRTHLLYSNWWE